jgi:hypothetical protein
MANQSAVIMGSQGDIAVWTFYDIAAASAGYKTGIPPAI